MENKKGFTLIELLAVIVILAIIALIATPIIMNVINDAKKGAAKDSAYAIIAAGELEMAKGGMKVPVTYTEDDDLNYKGTKPDKMKLDIDKNGKTNLVAFIDGYCVVKEYGEDEATIDETKKTADTCVTGSVTPPPVEGPKSFAEDSWSIIVEAVKKGNTSAYNVGDTKEVDLGSLGKHTIRIANMSSNDPVCSNSSYSQTACGFVLEFSDIINMHQMNEIETNVGGWSASEIYNYVNGTIYNALPDDLKNGIIDTRVVSGHGSDDAENFTSTDKLYLLSAKEVWNSGDVWNNGVSYDTSEVETRQLDYYKKMGVTTENYSGATKQYNGSNSEWWLRSVFSSNSYTFFIVRSDGGLGSRYTNETYGVSPAFRIG